MNILSALKFEGEGGSRIYTDETGRLWTFRNAVWIDTAQYKYGTSSGLFYGTNAWIDTPNFSLGAEDFTISLWVRPNNLAGNQNIFGGAGVAVYFEGSTALVALIGGFGAARNEADFVNNTWYHIALVRNGTSITLYVDGVGGTPSGVSGEITTSSTKFSIGRNADISANYLFGHVDDFSIIQHALWSEDFTPPSAFPELLTPQTPVTDKTAASFFNVADWIRINSNTIYANLQLSIYTNTNIQLDAVEAVPTTTSFPTAANFNLLLGNIERMRAVFNPAFASIKHNWGEGNTSSPTYVEVNSWETLLGQIIDFFYTSPSTEYHVLEDGVFYHLLEDGVSRHIIG